MGQMYGAYKSGHLCLIFNPTPTFLKVQRLVNGTDSIPVFGFLF